MTLFHFGFVDGGSFWFMEQEDPSVVAGALSDPLECFTNAWNIIKRCLTCPRGL